MSYLFLKQCSRKRYSHAEDLNHSAKSNWMDVQLIMASRCEFLSNPTTESLRGFKLCLKSFRPRITGNLILSVCQKDVFMQMILDILMMTLAKDQIQS